MCLDVFINLRNILWPSNWRLLEMSPFNTAHATSCWCSVVIMALYSVVSEIFSVEKCRDLEIRVRGHWRSLKVVPFDRQPMVSCYCSTVTLSVRCTNFEILDWRSLEISMVQWAWNPGWGSLKGIGTNTCRSTTYDLLLTFHSNHVPISYRFRDRERFPSKNAYFSHLRVFCASLMGFPWQLGIGTRVKKN